MKYEVFGRVNAGDDLLGIGYVEAPSDRLAKSYAYAQYDEEDWEDLYAVRREHMLDAADRGRMPDTPEPEPNAGESG